MEPELTELNEFLEKHSSLEESCHNRLHSLIEAYLSANNVYDNININKHNFNYFVI